MVAHAARGTFGPNMFPQDRELNRGWSVEGRRYRALEREIANTPGTFFFCCLLYADDTDCPAAVELGVFVATGYRSSGSVTASTSKMDWLGWVASASGPLVRRRGCHPRCAADLSVSAALTDRSNDGYQPMHEEGKLGPLGRPAS